MAAGVMNVDMFAFGVSRLPRAGEMAVGQEFKVGPGGKARNIAEMIAVLCGKNKVAFVGRTASDPYGLWKVNLDSFERVGVNCDFVKIEDFAKHKRFPGMALIVVDKHGENTITVVRGANKGFLPSDLDAARKLFEKAGGNKGLFVLNLGLPFETALRGVRLAKSLGLKVLIDPGGVTKEKKYLRLLNGVFLVKPNEHEAQIFTGVKVDGFESAERAAKILLKAGVENVLITMGGKGALFANRFSFVRLPIPEVKLTGVKNSAGCGDQTLAGFCFGLVRGKSVLDCAKLGVLAGTLQFGKSGIIPITRSELLNA